MVLDFGIRLGNGSALVELNGAWISLTLAGMNSPPVRRHSVLVEYGRVRDRVLEPVE